jgi:hypothetical protein
MPFCALPPLTRPRFRSAFCFWCAQRGSSDNITAVVLLLQW